MAASLHINLGAQIREKTKKGGPVIEIKGVFCALIRETLILNYPKVVFVLMTSSGLACHQTNMFDGLCFGHNKIILEQSKQ